jgi:hypothetical protein
MNELWPWSFTKTPASDVNPAIGSGTHFRKRWSTLNLSIGRIVVRVPSPSLPVLFPVAFALLFRLLASAELELEFVDLGTLLVDFRCGRAGVGWPTQLKWDCEGNRTGWYRCRACIPKTNILPKTNTVKPLTLVFIFFFFFFKQMERDMNFTCDVNQVIWSRSTLVSGLLGLRIVGVVIWVAPKLLFSLLSDLLFRFLVSAGLATKRWGSWILGRFS